MFKTLDDALAHIRDQAIEMVDLKFCDLWGRWHHVTLPSAHFTAKTVESGVGFDGSSLGLRPVSAGDLVLVPDLSSGFVDPFWERPTLGFVCRCLEADTRDPLGLDPRTVAARAEAHLAGSGIAERSSWGPEFEFYLFDGISYENSVNASCYRMESAEGHWRSAELGGGYTLRPRGGYHASPPHDRLQDVRAEICVRLESMGVRIKYHHHEVGGAGQCEIETPLLPIVQAADATLMAKYVTRMTARERGLTATFLPKPLFGEAGSGMHCHQQLWRGETNLFYDAEGYGSLSEVAHFYIGGLLAHGAAVMAITCPSTNSFRRLVPGFEAPVSAIFSLGNRSAAVRIPSYANRPGTARMEFRPPDATCNPYLALAAQLMAGIDGVRRRLDPTELGFGPIDENIFSWSAERRAQIKSLPTSLGEAIDALENDHAFLLEGGVFGQDLVERWIARKRQEVCQVRERPHPIEIEMYYDL
jgi:glutamine synthetase